MKLSFVKAESLLNDFVIVRIQDSFESSLSKISRFLSNRRIGIGCDQVIWVKPHNHLRFFNQDGSEAFACGNGTRAAALYLADPEITFITPHESIFCRVLNDHNVEMHLSFPKEIKPIELSLNLEWLYPPIFVDVGNKHIIVFPKNPLDPLIWGPKLFKDYPANINFVTGIDQNRLKLCVYERGSGLTPACGSGAFASFCAASSYGMTITHVDQKGGSLMFCPKESKIENLGQATIVFEGVITIDSSIKGCQLN